MGSQQSVGWEKENVHPGKNTAPQTFFTCADSPDDGVVDVIAMWERSVRDIFAALADEEGSRTFGFCVTQAKDPQGGELPAIALPPAVVAAGLNSSAAPPAPKPKFVAAGGARAIDSNFRLSAVNGQAVSGRTAQEIKDLVSAGRLVLHLDIVNAQAGCAHHKESRAVWCRRIQTLEKVKSRLDVFLNSCGSSRSRQHAASSGASSGAWGVEGLEMLRDGLLRLLQVFDATFNDRLSGKALDSKDDEKRVAALVGQISAGPQSFSHHIFSAIARVLLPPPPPPPPPPLAAARVGVESEEAVFASPIRTPLAQKGGGDEGGGGGGRGEGGRVGDVGGGGRGEGGSHILSAAKDGNVVCVCVCVWCGVCACVALINVLTDAILQVAWSVWRRK